MGKPRQSNCAPGSDCCGGSAVVPDVVGAPEAETSRPPDDFFTTAGAGALDAAYRQGWNDAIDLAKLTPPAPRPLQDAPEEKGT